MEKIRRICVWYYLLNKRLFKKRSFLILLLMVPLLVFGMRMVSKQDSGVVTIILCTSQSADGLSEELVEKLMTSESVIHYVTTDSKEEAYEAVQSGEVDAAWIFPENMQERMNAFVADFLKNPGVVTVVEREDNVSLQLAREKLYGELYDWLSVAIYKNYVTTKLGIEGEFTEEEFRSAYEVKEIKEQLFEFAFLDPNEDASGMEHIHYLLAPVRGLLSLVVVLVGLASALYYQQDKKDGTFARMSLKHRFLFEYGYHMIAISDCGIVVLLALYASGTFLSLGKEVLLMILFSMMCAGFAQLVRKLCGTAQRLAACIPILLLVMLVLCPVFFSVQGVRLVQYLLPPFYYLQAVHNSSVWCQMVVYVVVVLVLGKLVNRNN